MSGRLRTVRKGLLVRCGYRGGGYTIWGAQGASQGDGGGWPMTWDLMTGNVTEMEQTYERRLDRLQEEHDEPIRDQRTDRIYPEPSDR